MKIIQLKSGGSFGVRQDWVYEPQKQPKISREASETEYNLCSTECRYYWIVRINVSWLMDPISAFVLHPGNLRLLDT